MSLGSKGFAPIRLNKQAKHYSSNRLAFPNDRNDEADSDGLRATLRSYLAEGFSTSPSFLPSLLSFSSFFPFSLLYTSPLPPFFNVPGPLLFLALPFGISFPFRQTENPVLTSNGQPWKITARNCTKAKFGKPDFYLLYLFSDSSVEPNRKN